MKNKIAYFLLWKFVLYEIICFQYCSSIINGIPKKKKKKGPTH